MQENKYRNLDYFSLSYNLCYKNTFCLTNCKENAISPDKFKISGRKEKRNVCFSFKVLTKCINFAAENEHNAKERLSFGNNKQKSVFEKRQSIEVLTHY